MKKNICITFTISTFLLSSCGSSIASDAQKVAELQCKVAELQEKAFSDDASDKEELQEFMKEAQEFVQEMNKKYASIEEKQQFQEALFEAKIECN